MAIFKLAVQGTEWLAVGWTGEGWIHAPALLVLLVPAAGGLVVGLLLHAFGVPEDPGHGVTEVIESATLDLEEFPHRQVPLKASLAAVSLGSGAALGPEDPAVEIGGGLGKAIGLRFQLPHEFVRVLVAAGAAGGISALLHTPLAGILFSIEVVAVKVWSRAAVLVGVAAIAAFLAMELLVPGPPIDLLGPDQRIDVPPLVPGLLLAIALGLAAGCLSVIQIRFSYAVRHGFLHARTPPRWLKPAIGGAVLGAVGLVFPQLLGIGYDTVETVVGGDPHASGLLLALLAGKMLLMAVSFGSGMLGGFFAPAFFIGAMLGALVGTVGAMLAGPWVDVGTFAVIGMAAALAGMVHAPLTAAVALASLTTTPALLPFLLAASLASHLLARRLARGSLYTFTLDPRPVRPRTPDERDFGDQPDLR